MDDQSPPLAPCYECGKLTVWRLRRTWIINAPYRDDDGQVLFPGTPICDFVFVGDEDASCVRWLYSETSCPEALADKIALRHSRFDWTPLGGNGVTRPEPRGGF